VGDREIQYLSDCIRSGWISYGGKHVADFEGKFAEFCGAKYGVSTNSGTTALHLALAAAKIGPQDEVIIPSFTMIATPNAVSYTGAKPVLVDSELETWNIDASLIEAKVTKRTRAIIAVHTYGHPADMDAIIEIAKRHDLTVLEDAAEAHGAEYRGMKAGGLADMGCFSFYANKIITTGEGGMVVSNNPQLAERANWLRAHAFGRGGKHFWHEEIGFGYRMSALQAAVGLAQMEKIDEFVEKRRESAKLYNRLLSKVKGIGLPPEAPWAKNVYWMYSIRVQDHFGISRDDLMATLSKQGIETRTFFFPVHRQPAYSQMYEGQEYPNADELSRSGVNLPSGNNLSEREIEYVCKCIKEAGKP
jgi:perosamine synthetase